MLQPNRSQWIVICVAAAILVLAWPPARGVSLGVKAMRWAVDPTDALPALPPALPPGLGDNGDAVAEHDAIEAEYYRLHNSSAMTKWRMDMEAAGDPFDPTTERQVLIASAVCAALAIWRLGRRP
jgi:hypothetical protein